MQYSSHPDQHTSHLSRSIHLARHVPVLDNMHLDLVEYKDAVPYEHRFYPHLHQTQMLLPLFQTYRRSSLELAPLAFFHL